MEFRTAAVKSQIFFSWKTSCWCLRCSKRKVPLLAFWFNFTFTSSFYLFCFFFWFCFIFYIRLHKKCQTTGSDAIGLRGSVTGAGREESGSGWYFKVSESLWRRLVYDADVKHRTQWGLCPALRPWQWENCPLLVGRPIHLVREALPLPSFFFFFTTKTLVY